MFLSGREVGNGCTAEWYAWVGERSGLRGGRGLCCWMVEGWPTTDALLNGKAGWGR